MPTGTRDGVAICLAVHAASGLVQTMLGIGLKIIAKSVLSGT